MLHCRRTFHSEGKIPKIALSEEYSRLECCDCEKKRESQEHLSDVLSHAKCPRCYTRDKELLNMLEIITFSDAKVVGGNGLKAGIQV